MQNEDISVFDDQTKVLNVPFWIEHVHTWNYVYSPFKFSKNVNKYTHMNVRLLYFIIVRLDLKQKVKLRSTF